MCLANNTDNNYIYIVMYMHNKGENVEAVFSTEKLAIDYMEGETQFRMFRMLIDEKPPFDTPDVYSPDFLSYPSDPIGTQYQMSHPLRANGEWTEITAMEYNNWVRLKNADEDRPESLYARINLRKIEWAAGS